MLVSQIPDETRAHTERKQIFFSATSKRLVVTDTHKHTHTHTHTHTHLYTKPAWYWVICRDLQQLPSRTIQSSLRVCVCARACVCLAVTTVGDHSEPSKHLSWPEAHTHTHTHTHTELFASSLHLIPPPPSWFHPSICPSTLHTGGCPLSLSVSFLLLNPSFLSHIPSFSLSSSLSLPLFFPSVFSTMRQKGEGDERGGIEEGDEGKDEEHDERRWITKIQTATHTLTAYTHTHTHIYGNMWTSCDSTGGATLLPKTLLPVYSFSPSLPPTFPPCFPPTDLPSIPPLF